MISQDLIDRVGLRTIQQITTLPFDQARSLLESSGDFSPGEIAELMTLSKQPLIQKQDIRMGYYYKRRMCFGALWLLGASWGQIGALYEISRQTVMDSAHRALAGAPIPRLARRCSFERISEYNTQFWKDVEAGLIPLSWNPYQVAEYISTHTEMDTDAD